MLYNYAAGKSYEYWGSGVIMDEHLIRQAKNGSQEALAQLLYMNYEIVFKYLIKFTLNVNFAEDMTQETMIKAIEKFEVYDPKKSKFSTWLIAIAQNICIDNIRKQKRNKKYIEEALYTELLEASYEDPDDSLGRVLDALGKLPEESRYPVLLKHYYGYSYEEIARLMKIPEGTVKSRIHNALKLIRKELE